MVQLIDSDRSCAAHRLTPPQRRDLVLPILSGHQSTSQAAREHDVSRKFVAQQTDKARTALEQAFTPTPPDDAVLFHLPVTQQWIEQAALGLLLICHSSLRGVSEFFRDLLDHPIAHTTVRNIFHKAIAPARACTRAVDLSTVRIGAHDEIFQSGQPVLVGADVDSTYCYLLSPEERRDADTWGVRLLELGDRGWNPDATIADFAGGIRSAQEQTFPDLPCRGDLFHILKSLTDAARGLEHRAYRAIENHWELQGKQQKYEWRHGRKDLSLVNFIRHAAAEEHAAITVYDNVQMLIDWLHDDIWPVAGPSYETRCELFDFVLDELRSRVAEAGSPLRKVCTTLKNHRDDLLAFAKELDGELAELAATFGADVEWFRELMQHDDGNPNRPEYWQREAELHRQSGGRLHAMRAAVQQLRERVVRASSVIENLNSRLRGYFFLRRQVSGEYLEVLQFFLNHRRFVRSEHANRVNKSPCELLTGVEHRHWLELLGYTRFSRN